MHFIVDAIKITRDCSLTINFTDESSGNYPYIKIEYLKIQRGNQILLRNKLKYFFFRNLWIKKMAIPKETLQRRYLIKSGCRY